MHLFITTTTYAQWLPGDERGFVSRVNSEIHNQYATPVDKDVLWLKKHAEKRLKGDPIFLNLEHARILFEQFQETVAYRQWKLHGVAIMPNHVHILLETGDDTKPEQAACDLKRYGSRRLSAVFGKPKSETWWTTGCSLRRKATDALPNVVRYIKDQRHALLVWIAPEYDEYDEYGEYGVE